VNRPPSPLNMLLSRHTRRREFIALLGAATAEWPLAARAQQGRQMGRVGVLLPFDENDPEAKNRLKQFRLGMRDLDWIEGRNVLIDFRFSGGDSESIKRSVAELVKAAPEVILSYSTPGLAAVQRATSTIPIVFGTVTDPLGQGIVPSLAYPGGNTTGFSFIEPEMVGKWINLLGDVKPGLSRAVLMFNPDTASFFDPYYRSFKAAPQRSAVEVDVAHVRTAGEIESAIAKLGNEQNSGLILGSDIFLINMREPTIKLANERGVPTISAYRQFVVDGSLVAYGPDTGDISRRASAYVDRILRGERPGNLPVQSPIRFELILNLKTAKALGLSVRESFLELCDEVIE
jgi:putative tryptophan/tyrosine transport system substrate-binding protein